MGEGLNALVGAVLVVTPLSIYLAIAFIGELLDAIRSVDPVQLGRKVQPQPDDRRSFFTCPARP